MLKMAAMTIRKSESLKFYKYLCQKIESEKVVRTRRLAFTIRDIGHRSTLIASGSKGEGLYLNGSDFDIKLVDPNFKVYQSEKEVQNQCFAIPLIMNTEETQPCFTQLWLFNDNIELNPNVLEKNYRGCMLSSKLYKLCYKNFADAKIPSLFLGKIHGPCISNIHDTLDVAWCLKCDKWIFQAKPWISRPRTTWPSPKIISKVKYTDENIYLGSLKHKHTFNHIHKLVLSLMKKEKLHTVIKSFTINPIYFKVKSSIIPQELQLDVANTGKFFHSLPFAHFLSFLCYYHQHDISSCRQSLQRLKYFEGTLGDCGTKCFYPKSVDSLIFCGIAHQLMGEACVAKQAFQAAARFDTFHMTSARSRLFSLVRRFHTCYFVCNFV
ncbi:unnamed protein product [Mytilus coruscus]|uniref:Mab-21-like HhH/H2TH-like domain-containing protein n=1 Tax=Mytilus coruscus TaxID=42192 RepID=A0A6J8AUC8_MYTCO|nr:unnamed protein product [Mytilus coruscus]